MSSNYKAGQIREIAELKEVIERVNNEFKLLESAFDQPLRLPVLSAEPDKPRDGTVAYADGVAWDPGEGQGYYAYFDGAWHKLNVAADLDGVEGDISDIEDAITVIEGDITAIEGDITAIEADITALEAAVLLGHAPNVIVEDQKSATTAGGTATSGSWQTRTLNTLVRNSGSIASLSSNEVTLPAGTYYIQWSAPAYYCNANKSRLYNVTDAAVVAVGTTALCAVSGIGGAMVTDSSTGSVVVTTAGSKAFRIEHQVTTTRATDGYGVASGFSTIETYARMEVTKIA